MPAETMTCPTCKRTGLGVTYRVARLAGGGKARIRVPARHNRLDTGRPCEPERGGRRPPDRTVR